MDKGNYKMIYAFEPNSAMIPVLNHMMETEQIKKRDFDSKGHME